MQAVLSYMVGFMGACGNLLRHNGLRTQFASLLILRSADLFGNYGTLVSFYWRDKSKKLPTQFRKSHNLYLLPLVINQHLQIKDNVCTRNVIFRVKRYHIPRFQYTFKDVPPPARNTFHSIELI